MNDRILKMLRETDFYQLKNSSVLIVGIGGVGGFAAEALTRSGIGKIIILDNDIIEETNLNRQIIALRSTLTQKKVDVIKFRILDINPDCQVIIDDVFLTKDNINEAFKDKKVDYIIDACDTVTTKIAIIEYCLSNNIKFISCMGTGNRLNPERVKITSIKKTNNDPLAKVIRKILKTNNIKGNIPVVWSEELPIKNHSKIPGSLILVPATAGILCASFIINQILNNKLSINKNDR